MPRFLTFVIGVVMFGAWAFSVQAEFVNNGNGTVTDTSSGLMWQQVTALNNHNYDSMTWREALAYCEALDLGGEIDWRLPTIKELASIVGFNGYNLAIDTTYFQYTLPANYWSSTTAVSGTNEAWVRSFGHGFDSRVGKNYSYYDRAVRGGQNYYVSATSGCGGKVPCYTAIQAAVDAAPNGSVVRISKGTYNEPITLDELKNVTLQGGWNASYTLQTTNSTFIKSPNAPKGSLTMQMLTIKP